ncbi:MAG: hypothetical protein R3F02_20320 [Thiolinea sp.]
MGDSKGTQLIEIVGYHTCSSYGGRTHVLANAPFFCDPDNEQWLTDGYYFWTDSDYFAHDWGKKGRGYRRGYAIVQCRIMIDSDLLLDLVGNVDHQLYFEDMIQAYKERLQQAGSIENSVTVSQVIAYWRDQAQAEKDIFPYIAIKAQDGRHEDRLNFVEERREYMPRLTRQQLCLFQEGKDSIKNKCLVHPTLWANSQKPCN